MAGEIKSITVKEDLKKYYEEGWQIATWLNDHPEVSGQEKESSRYLIDMLKKRDYRVESPCQGVKYSFRAVSKRKGRKKKPKIAVLCEYDSIEGLGQACGHSLSCAASIICANALNELREDLPFQLDLIGTPGEEVHGGKISLLQKGVFNEYECAVIAHMNNVNQPSFKNLASSDLVINYYGKAAHASVEPWKGANALNGLQLFFHATDMLRQVLEPDDQIQGVILEGGVIPNQIPAKATGYIYLRAATIEKLKHLQSRVINCAKGAAIATETNYDTAQMTPTYVELFLGDTAHDMICDIMSEEKMEWEEQQKPAGSSDIGNVDQVIPVFHPMISLGHREIALYSKEFGELVKSESGRLAMEQGARVIIRIIERLAEEPELFDRIRREHEEYRNLDKE